MTAIALARLNMALVFNIVHEVLPIGFPTPRKAVLDAAHHCYKMDKPYYMALRPSGWRDPKSMTPSSPKPYCQDLPPKLFKRVVALSKIDALTSSKFFGVNPMLWDFSLKQSLYLCDPSQLRSLDAADRNLLLKSCSRNPTGEKLVAAKDLKAGYIICFVSGALLYHTWDDLEQLHTDLDPAYRHFYGQGQLTVSKTDYRGINIPLIPRNVKRGKSLEEVVQVYLVPHRFSSVYSVNIVPTDANARIYVYKSRSMELNNLVESGCVVVRLSKDIPTGASVLLGDPSKREYAPIYV